MPLRGLSQADFERAIRQREVECGVAYHPDGTQAFEPRTGERNRVLFPSPDETDLSGTTFVHNHTEIRRLSNGDLFEAARHRAKSVVATLPNGTTLRLTVPDFRDWPIEELIDRQESIRERADDRFGYGLDDGRALDAKHRWMIQRQAEEFADLGVILEVERE